MSSNSHPVNILMILDGWGIRDETHGNAFALAKTPFLDSLIKKFPTCKLLCSGNAVGLPEGTMGNSEVGHMNIGAGRKVLQDFVRINKAIEDQSFFKTPALLDLMAQVSNNQKSLHIMGLLSDGGVHSHISHLFALIDMAKQNKVENLFIHPILDGRDTSPASGINYIKQLQAYLDHHEYGKIATLVGRYWAMDRDTRWDRVEKAYKLFTAAAGVMEQDPVCAVQNAYDSDKTDEFVPPIFLEKNLSQNKKINNGIVQDGDGLIFFNFRADRAKEITRAFTESAFNEFARGKKIDLAGFVCMTQYDETFNLPVAFAPQHLDQVLGEILSQNSISQLRIAETEKYAHVTYFFNGGDEKVFDGEKRILIPSPRDVATYDEKPQMSAFELADKACEQIRAGAFQFIILNFANMDMVGHTGILKAAVKGCETVDKCAQKVVEAIWETGGFAIVTADHGNSEQMIADDGSAHTAHTLNPVRLILAGDKLKEKKLKDGILGDIAPTILKLLNIEQPLQMTGTSLI
ncbi:2,3-bisphosphoglycerate-independent phosphoglycerate mutase [Desulfobacula toluolica]|uniref:2,3-bisphosphoglycerate-independent phosphoglycerate mutase n=1 Tax=Desulfobacula toluolica (strain DSM 7467 / Tol2) TaxID=651182 RepID=K0NIN0_DESTT|nr:2,3-bisphosphoglycerate-independent phosphoglycerate mutase [Desulfobacula toluolica]CCK81281.1 GpmI: phosphoglycerate mutase [Desulfobacula toluolica Tol2]